MHSVKQESGLTLTELLVVIALVGILAAVTISTINPRRHQDTVADATNRQRLKETADALEMFRNVEGYYPRAGTAGNPLDASAGDRVDFGVYLSTWPQGVVYLLDATGFSIHVTRQYTPGFLKYYSVWGQVRECADSMTQTSTSSCP